MSKKSIVLGAGISGLALAWELQKSDDVIVIEKEDRAGGWIRTIDYEGFLFEQGPRSCRRKGAGAATLQLIEELGLQSEVIDADSKAKFRYLWFEERLQQLPTGPLSFFQSPLMKGMLGALWRDLQTPPSEEDESIYDFFNRRFSPDIADRLIDPMAKGIYAGDIRKLSIRSCFPTLHDWEQAHGSILRGAFSQKKTKGKGGIFSFRGGMETLPRELAKRVNVQFANKVSSLIFEKDFVRVILEDGSSLDADRVYSTLPANVLGKLLGNELLGKIPAVSLAVVNLGYRTPVLQRKGFGYLIPSNEEEQILGVVFDSSAFPQQNRHPDETRLTAMVAYDPNYSDFDYLTFALDALARHLGIEKAPDTHLITIAHEAIPQYHVGHASLVSKIEAEMPEKLKLLGNSFYGVAVNDCIQNAISSCSSPI